VDFLEPTMALVSCPKCSTNTQQGGYPSGWSSSASASSLWVCWPCWPARSPPPAAAAGTRFRA